MTPAVLWRDPCWITRLSCSIFFHVKHPATETA